MNIWFFGDSFFEPYTETHWPKLLADKFNAPIKNFGLGGTSLGYTYCQYDQHVDSFDNDDIIVIGLTSISRTYFFYDRPCIAVYHPLYAGDVTSNELKAMKYYTQYLDNIYEKQINVKNFLSRVNSNKQRAIILPLFDDYSFINTSKYTNLLWAHGPSLTTISINEYINEDIQRKIFTRDGPADLRMNHLCYHNHQILADKLYNGLNGAPIDFSHGFDQKFIDLEYDLGIWG